MLNHMTIRNITIAISNFLFAGMSFFVYAQGNVDFPPNENIFDDDLSVDLKVNGNDGPVKIVVGDQITISWESEGAKRCRGSWSKKDLPLKGRVTGRLNRSLTGVLTIRFACIDTDGNRKDDSVTLNINSQPTLTSPPSPPSSEKPTIISSCGEITKGGRYMLNRNLSTEKDVCLDIHDTRDIHLDCNNFIVTGLFDSIKITNVQDFSIKFCQIKATGGLNALSISKATKGNIQNNEFPQGQIAISDSSRLNIGHNNISTALIEFFSSFNTIHHNIFTDTSLKGVAGLISSAYGSNNRIENNTIDGKSDGVFKFPYENNNGADDGIVVTYETGDAISGNIIKNVWDCGIENTGYLFDSTIDHNEITNAGVCGIGGWIVNSWRNNQVTNNIVTNSPRLFYFYRISGFSSSNTDMAGRVLFPLETKIYFLNNQFKDNKISKKRLGTEKISYIHMLQARNVNKEERNPATEDFVTGNNFFTNNDFTSDTDAPVFIPPSMVVDGGGNTCGKSSDLNYPLACGR